MEKLKSTPREDSIRTTQNRFNDITRDLSVYDNNIYINIRDNIFSDFFLICIINQKSNTIMFNLQTKIKDGNKTIRHPFYNAFEFKRLSLDYATNQLNIPINLIQSEYQPHSINYKQFFEIYDKFKDNRLEAIKKTWSYQTNIKLGYTIKNKENISIINPNRERIDHYFIDDTARIEAYFQKI